VDASLITGFPSLTALTVADGFLYVADAVNGTIGKYNLDGTVVNAGLVMGLGSTPEGVAVSGTDLFVANPGNGTIGKYTTDGGIINRDFIIDVPDPRRLAVHGGVLYVSNFGAGSISTYDAATGATLDAALITGLSGPLGIAVSGDGLNLYVANRDGNTIGLFPTSGGMGDPDFIDMGLSGPSGLAVVDSLQLTSAVSRKTHGTAGTFDVNLPLAGEPGLECRNSGGKHKFVFFFNNTVVSGDASVTLGTGSVFGSPVFSGNTMTVNLTGVTDVQKITVTLTDVTDTSSHVLPSTDVSANMLIGDTSADKIVSSFDVRQTRLQVGVPVTTANFREDVKPDGSITSIDVGQVRSRVGNSLP
jgi:DNA-binding beta-propeller fold protein YncE